ncbi:hypothetical protein SLEP1_g56923 [Rubroshorea leprosula]|uniref:Mei2-like C-terminal RNA recognition motif domain-containing protein n=1 Tax=Rubroshorea leprosula TaxID=152421 RepID=A0AAV5MJQ1_9ROSI|nr:hypothetical protein SLEP1_g56923 [Rubroshorea leprosula]
MHLPVMENHWRLPFPRDPFGVGVNLSQSETVLNLQYARCFQMNANGTSMPLSHIQPTLEPPSIPHGVLPTRHVYYEATTNMSHACPAMKPQALPTTNHNTHETPVTPCQTLFQHGVITLIMRLPYVEIASHNIFSHAGGNNGVVHPPQQMCHLFPGRNPVISMPGSFKSPIECVRNFSHHRNESNSNNADKKQCELDIDRIIHEEDSRTMLMIKNIPNKYASKNKCNVYYAFINMIDPQQIIPFHKAFNGKKWEKFNNEKVAPLAYARIYGKAALIAHFQNSSLINEDKRCHPILCHSDGPNAGAQPFPMDTNINQNLESLEQPVLRTIANPENNCQGSSSTLAKSEEPSSEVDSWSSYLKYSN